MSRTWDLKILLFKGLTKSSKVLWYCMACYYSFNYEIKKKVLISIFFQLYLHNVFFMTTQATDLTQIFSLKFVIDRIKIKNNFIFVFYYLVVILGLFVFAICLLVLYFVRGSIKNILILL